MKETPQKYVCKTCKEEREDNKNYLEGQCALCQALSLKSRYMKDKLSRLTKFAQHQEIKALLKKKSKNDTESSDFSDDISVDEMKMIQILFYLLRTRVKPNLNHLPSTKLTKNGQKHFHLVALLLKNSKNKKKIQKSNKTVTITRVTLKTKLCNTL